MIQIQSQISSTPKNNSWLTTSQANIRQPHKLYNSFTFVQVRSERSVFLKVVTPENAIREEVIYRLRDNLGLQEYVPRLLEDIAPAEEYDSFLRQHDVAPERLKVFCLEEGLFSLGQLAGEAGRADWLQHLDLGYLSFRIVEVMAALHARGVAHRDFKLENLVFFQNACADPHPILSRTDVEPWDDKLLEMLRQGGNVKAIDFGYAALHFKALWKARSADPEALEASLSRLKEPEQTMRRLWMKTADQIKWNEGSPGLMSPQALEYRTTPYDFFANDVWALGVTLFRLVTGTYPYDRVRRLDKETDCVFMRRALLCYPAVLRDLYLRGALSGAWYGLFLDIFQVEERLRPTALQILHRPVFDAFNSCSSS